MKKLLCVCAAMVLGLLAATAVAADITGTWTGEMKSPDGNSYQIDFNFKQDGTKLTGSVQGPQGEPMEINNGTIDGDKFSFDVAFNGTTIHGQCTVEGDEIKLTSKSDQGDFNGIAMTLKRAAATPVPPPPQ